jgi:hypothetical protein
MQSWLLMLFVLLLVNKILLFIELLDVHFLSKEILAFPFCGKTGCERREKFNQWYEKT